MKGIFIVIEGIDGCGKGTVSTRLAQELFDIDKDNHVYLTRNPYDRAWLNEYLSKAIDNRGEEAMKLFVQDRLKHCEIIKHLLQDHNIIISDRFSYSTYAYQMAQGVPFESIKEAHKDVLRPDLVIVLDLPVEEAIKRMNHNRTGQDGFEKKEFLKKVRENYLKLKEILNENIVYVDGAKTRDEVYKGVKEHVLKALKK